MCMSCGCGDPNNNHGDNRNITQDDLNRAAQAAGVSQQQAAQNIANSVNPGNALNTSLPGIGGPNPADTQGPGYYVKPGEKGYPPGFGPQGQQGQQNQQSGH